MESQTSASSTPTTSPPVAIREDLAGVQAILSAFVGLTNFCGSMHRPVVGVGFDIWG